MRLRSLAGWATAAGAICCQAGSDVPPQGLPGMFATSDERWDDSDLHKFVTRPDLTPPVFDVVRHDRNRVAPGYIFVAPYSTLVMGSEVTSYLTQQTGPMIYDQNGDLVWSGVEHFRNKAGHDFKTARLNGTDHLTTIARDGLSSTDAFRGSCHILDSSYRLVASYTPSLGADAQDMHEFTVLGDSATALRTQFRQRETFVDSTASQSGVMAWDDVFQEFDLASSKVLFEWSSLDHVPISESWHNTSDPPRAAPDPPRGAPLDYFHLNSVDKTPDGDYLISARHASTIYLISGKDGSIIWRLGGSQSSFEQIGFNFSRQHNARLLSQNASTTVISLLDNAAWDTWGSDHPTSAMSSILIVALQTAARPMTAGLVRRYLRPDGEFTGARGNAQLLPNGNVFGGWGDNAYMTEHTAAGDVVYEAIFMSSRFQNYRAYKLNFTGRPLDAPAVKASVQASTRWGPNTVVHVSWNGATEVERWRFYSVQGGGEALLGSARRTGFETAFVARGYHATVFAEALDAEGHSLANSSLEDTEVPLGWTQAAEGKLGGRMKAAAMDTLWDYGRFVPIVSFTCGALSMWLWHRMFRGVGVVAERLPLPAAWKHARD